MMKRPDWFTRAAVAGVLAAGLAATGCESSDPVAPADSTITLSANPQTVVVSSGGSGTSEIVARLRSKNGTPLPGQEVTFSTTFGTLNPSASTPLTTDSSGQCTSILTTPTGATVTAHSGGVTPGTVIITTTSGNLARYIIQVTPSELTDCGDDLTLTGIVATTTGDPVPGIAVIFDEVSPGTLTGNFTPGSQILTDSSGRAVVMWTPSLSVCAAQCQAATADPLDPTPGDCTLFFTARDTTGTFESVAEEVNDNIP